MDGMVEERFSAQKETSAAMHAHSYSYLVSRSITSLVDYLISYKILFYPPHPLTLPVLSDDTHSYSFSITGPQARRQSDIGAASLQQPARAVSAM